jgi:hypothetical protein
VQQPVAQPNINANTSAQVLQVSLLNVILTYIFQALVELQLVSFIANGRKLATQIRNQATLNVIDEEFKK